MTHKKEGSISVAHCKVLSIDGGGIRGIIPAVILKNLEKDIQIPIHEFFTIGAGSSAGALIVLQLNALNLPASTILANFTEQNMIQKMFKKRFFHFLSLFYGAIYSGTSKTKMIESILTSNMPFKAIKKPTLITAYDLSNQISVVFKSTGGSDADRNATISEVADASSAAPTYFPPINVNGNWLVDGGISENDPCMCALSYALTLGYSLEEVKVLSLGTGLSKKQSEIRKEHVKSAASWGKAEWLKHGIIDDLMRGNTTTSEYQCKTLLKNNHLRINPIIDHASDALDDISPSNISKLTEIGEDAYKQYKDQILEFLS